MIQYVNYGNTFILVISITEKHNCFAMHFIFTGNSQYMGSVDLTKCYFVNTVLFFFFFFFIIFPHIQHVFMPYEAVTECFNEALTVCCIGPPPSLLYSLGTVHKTDLAPHLTTAESMQKACTATMQHGHRVTLLQLHLVPS